MNDELLQEEQKETLGDKGIRAYEYSQSFVAKWISLILTLIVALAIFFITSMTGGKEIKAPKSVGGQIMAQWREDNPGEMFPEQYMGTIEFTIKGAFGDETHEYYFVVEEYVKDENGVETSVVQSWYWAYDGGINYVFSDWRFYFFTALVFALSSFVVVVNYNSSKNKARTSKTFKATAHQYALAKEDIKEDIDLLDDFCVYQNKKAYDDKKQEIVIEADVLWSEYIKPTFDKKNLYFWQKNNSGLANWQKRKLKQVRKIKIKNRLKKTDLLQESASLSRTKIQMLPQSESSHDKRYFTFNMIQRFITIAASGLIIAFSIELIDFNLGITYGVTILTAAIGATIAGADFVLTKLRNRMISKRDYLIEFKAMIPTLRKQKLERELAFKKAYEEQMAKETKQQKDYEDAKKNYNQKEDKPLLNKPQIINI